MIESSSRCDTTQVDLDVIKIRLITYAAFRLVGADFLSVFCMVTMNNDEDEDSIFIVMYTRIMPEISTCTRADLQRSFVCIFRTVRWDPDIVL